MRVSEVLGAPSMEDVCKMREAMKPRIRWNWKIMLWQPVPDMYVDVNLRRMTVCQNLNRRIILRRAGH